VCNGFRCLCVEVGVDFYERISESAGFINVENFLISWKTLSVPAQNMLQSDVLCTFSIVFIIFIITSHLVLVNQVYHNMSELIHDIFISVLPSDNYIYWSDEFFFAQCCTTWLMSVSLTSFPTSHRRPPFKCSVVSFCFILSPCLPENRDMNDSTTDQGCGCLFYPHHGYYYIRQITIISVGFLFIYLFIFLPLNFTYFYFITIAVKFCVLIFK